MDNTNIILWVLIALISMMGAFMVISFIYSFVTMYRQDKQLINNLKVGDETCYGKVSGIDGEVVIINREPLRIPKYNIRPKEYKVNKILFMLGGTK